MRRLAETSPPHGYELPERHGSLFPQDVGLTQGLLWPQTRCLLHPARHKLYVGGNGGGKKTVGAYWALLQAAHPANRGRTIGVLAPTGIDAETTHRDLFERMNDEFFTRHGYSLFVREDKDIGSYHTIFGSRILRQSYRQNTKRLANTEFAAMWVSSFDLEYMPDTAINEIMGRLRAGGTGASLWTTRPNGDQGAVRYFLKSIQTLDAEKVHEYATFRCPSWENPAVTAADLALWRRTFSEQEWQSWVCANVTASTELVFPAFRRERHITDWWPDDPKTHPWILGIDWGQTHAHVTAAWVRMDHDHQIVVFQEWHGQDVTDERVVQEAMAICGRLKCWPHEVVSDGAPNARPANRLLSETIGSGAKIRQMKSGDKAIWMGTSLMRSALSPPPGKEPGLLLNRRVCGQEAVACGTLEMLEKTRRAKNADGDLIDKVAENRRLEHAFDVLRYICTTVWGMRHSRIWTSNAT